MKKRTKPNFFKIIPLLILLSSCGAYSPFYNGHLIHVKSKPIEKNEIIKPNDTDQEALTKNQSQNTEQKVTPEETTYNQETITPTSTQIEVQELEDILVLNRSIKKQDKIQNTPDLSEEEIIKQATKAEKRARKAAIFSAMSFIPMAGVVFFIIGIICLGIASRSRYITPKGQKYIVRSIILLSIYGFFVLSVAALVVYFTNF